MNRLIQSIAIPILALLATLIAGSASAKEITNFEWKPLTQIFEITYDDGSRSPFSLHSPLPSEIEAQLTPAQKGRLSRSCKILNDSWLTRSCDPSFTFGAAEEKALQEYLEEEEYRKAGGWALRLFDYSMGGPNGGNNDCITCSFLGSFMIGLSSFSAAVFEYFQAAFNLLVPILMLIWVGQKTVRLFITGGEDGRSFIYSVLFKLTLFFFVWAFTSSGDSTLSVANDKGGSGAETSSAAPSWDLAGPKYLAFAFGITNEIRAATLVNRGYITDAKTAPTANAFNCDYTTDNLKAYTDINSLAKFTATALNLSCSTERVHMVGFSSGLAIIKSSGSQLGFSWTTYPDFIIKLITGVFLLVIFALSAIWFTFLILDVVVRGLITAAFLPLIMGAALFGPTRYIATGAVKSLAGAVMTAVAIGIVSTLAFFLLTNTITVYNNLAEVFETIDGVPLSPIDMGADGERSLSEAFREFLVRIQADSTSDLSIPLDLHTPWFYYIALSGLAIFSLGKKIISMVEGFIGTRESSAMADNAMKLAKTGATMGMQAGTAAALMAPQAGKMGLAATGASISAFKAFNPFGGGSSGGNDSGGGLNLPSSSEE